MKPRIVIAGFGDSGVLVAAHLKKKYEIIGISTKADTVVSGQELGTRLTRPEHWKDVYLLPFRKIKQLDDVKILHGKAINLDPKSSELTVSTDKERTTFAYDVLVIATGTTNGFWRTTDVEHPAETEQKLEAHATKLASAGTVAIVGAGPTGVSVA